MTKLVASWLFASVLVVPAAGAQNLLANPDFDSSPASWVVGCGTVPTWTANDEGSCPGSGSAHQSSGACQGAQGAGLGQCVPAGAMTTVWAEARLRPSAGFGGVLLTFFDGAGCTGNEIATQLSPQFPATGSWITVAFDQPVPVGTASILVGFGAVSFGALELDLDSGYFGGSERIFRDDFEGDTGGATSACRWSSTLP